MPKYKVTGPGGRKFTLTGDSPPTEAELEEFFASLGPTGVSSSAEGASASSAAPIEDVERRQTLAEGLRTTTAFDEQAAIQQLNPKKSKDLFKLQQLVEGKPIKIGNQVIKAQEPEAQEFARKRWQSGLPSGKSGIEKKDGKFTFTDKGIFQEAKEALIGKQHLEEAEKSGFFGAAFETGLGLLGAPSRALGSLTGQGEMGDIRTQLYRSEEVEMHEQLRKSKLATTDNAIKVLYQKEQLTKDPALRNLIRQHRRQAQMDRERIKGISGIELMAQIGSAGVSDPLTYIDAAFAGGKGLAALSKTRPALGAGRVIAEAGGRAARTLESLGREGSRVRGLGEALVRGGRGLEARTIQPARAALSRLGGEGLPTEVVSEAVREAGQEAAVFAPERTPRELVEKLITKRPETEAAIEQIAGKIGDVRPQIPEEMASSVLDLEPDAFAEATKRVGAEFTEGARTELRQGQKALDIEKTLLEGQPLEGGPEAVSDLVEALVPTTPFDITGSGPLKALDDLVNMSRSEELKSIPSESLKLIRDIAAKASRGGDVEYADILKLKRELSNVAWGSKELKGNTAKFLKDTSTELNKVIGDNTIRRMENLSPGDQVHATLTDILAGVGKDIVQDSPVETYKALRKVLSSQTGLRNQVIKDVFKAHKVNGGRLNIDEFDAAAENARKYVDRILNVKSLGQKDITDIREFRKLQQLDETLKTDFAPRMQSLWEVLKYTETTRGTGGRVIGFKLPINPDNKGFVFRNLKGSDPFSRVGRGIADNVTGFFKAVSGMSREDLGTTAMANTGVNMVTSLIKGGMTPYKILQEAESKGLSIYVVEKLVRWIEQARLKTEAQ